MRRLTSYYRKCLAKAASGIFQIANSYFWLVGALVVWGSLRLAGYEMEIPNNIPGGVMAAAAFVVVTLPVVFVIRLIFAAPFQLFKENELRIEGLERRLSVPDLAIETRRVPDIVQTKDGTIHIIIRNFHLTNRSDFAVSVEARMRFNFGGQMSLVPDHDDIPPDFMELSRQQDPTIGRHWPTRISLPAHEGGNGYLSYTIPNYDGSPVFAMATVAGREVVALLEQAEHEVEIIEHVSGMTRTIPVRAFGQYSFRDLNHGNRP
jgi:hypothetical protein